MQIWFSSFNSQKLICVRKKFDYDRQNFPSALAKWTSVLPASKGIIIFFIRYYQQYYHFSIHKTTFKFDLLNIYEFFFKTLVIFPFLLDFFFVDHFSCSTSLLDSRFNSKITCCFLVWFRSISRQFTLNRFEVAQMLPQILLFHFRFFFFFYT